MEAGEERSDERAGTLADNISGSSSKRGLLVLSAIYYIIKELHPGIMAVQFLQQNIRLLAEKYLPFYKDFSVIFHLFPKGVVMQRTPSVALLKQHSSNMIALGQLQQLQCFN